MDNAQSLAILLATPAGVAVVGALLWWRVGNVEREVTKLRDQKHEDASTIAALKGSVDLMERLVSDLVNNYLAPRSRRKGEG